jgi:hypothetical protein
MNKNKKQPLIFIFVILISFFLISGLIFFFILSPEEEELSEYFEIMDIYSEEKFGKNFVIFTATIFKEIDLDKCKIKLNNYEFEYLSSQKNNIYNFLNFPYSIKGEFFEKNVVFNKPLSTTPFYLDYDLDYDGINDFMFICGPYNSCPNSYDGKYLAFNLSSSNRLIYINLKNQEGYIDLTKGFQDLNTPILYSDIILDNRIAIQIKGNTLDLPYLIGLNNENLILFSNFFKIPDINFDLKEDYIDINSKEIIIFLSTIKEPYIISINKLTNIYNFSLEGINYYIDLDKEIINYYGNYYSIDSIRKTRDDNILFPLDIIRFFLVYPDNKINSYDKLSLLCK